MGRAAPLILVTFALACCGGGLRAGDCDEARAKTVRSVSITKLGFDETCVKTSTGAEVSFVNRDLSAHSATTAPGAPQQFDASLPHQNSTFSQVFAKGGVYRIRDKGRGHEMTLLVT